MRFGSDTNLLLAQHRCVTCESPTAQLVLAGVATGSHGMWVLLHETAPATSRISAGAGAHGGVAACALTVGGIYAALDATFSANATQSGSGVNTSTDSVGGRTDNAWLHTLMGIVVTMVSVLASVLGGHSYWAQRSMTPSRTVRFPDTTSRVAASASDGFLGVILAYALHFCGVSLVLVSLDVGWLSDSPPDELAVPGIVAVALPAIVLSLSRFDWWLPLVGSVTCFVQPAFHASYDTSERYVFPRIVSFVLIVASAVAAARRKCYTTGSIL